MLHAEKEIRTTLKCISLECYSFSNFASVETERGYTSLPLSSILPFASQKRHQKEARDEESRWKSQRNTTVLSRCIQVESVFTVKKEPDASLRPSYQPMQTAEEEKLQNVLQCCPFCTIDSEAPKISLFILSFIISNNKGFVCALRM